jgi:hypothetical protein
MKLAGATMHEQQLVTIGVARQMIHRCSGIPYAHTYVRVTQDLRRLPWRGLILIELIQIESVRAQWPFELHPAGGRMTMMKERGRTEKAFLADLALERPLRQVGMRLPRGGALDSRRNDGPFHGRLRCDLKSRRGAFDRARWIRTAP